MRAIADPLRIVSGEDSAARKAERRLSAGLEKDRRREAFEEARKCQAEVPAELDRACAGLDAFLPAREVALGLRRHLEDFDSWIREPKAATAERLSATIQRLDKIRDALDEGRSERFRGAAKAIRESDVRRLAEEAASALERDQLATALDRIARLRKALGPVLEWVEEGAPAPGRDLRNACRDAGSMAESARATAAELQQALKSNGVLTRAQIMQAKQLERGLEEAAKSVERLASGAAPVPAEIARLCAADLREATKLLGEAELSPSLDGILGPACDRLAILAKDDRPSWVARAPQERLVRLGGAKGVAAEHRSLAGAVERMEGARLAAKQMRKAADHLERGELDSARKEQKDALDSLPR